MIFTHSGNAGDIIFSLPTIHHLTNGEKKAILYIKAARYVYGDQYNFTRDILLEQDSIKEVHPFIPSDNNWNYFNWPGLKFDYDLDTARNQRQRGRIHIIKRYFDQFGIKKDHTQPGWLKIDTEEPRDEKFALIHLTPRWNGLQYNWERIYAEAVARHGKVYFIGLQTEWLDFTIRFGAIEHLPTENLLQMARFIRDCEALYCNQGVALTIAQGFGKEYYLARNGQKTNCLLYTKNEHVYEPNYLIPNHTLGALPDSHLIR